MMVSRREFLRMTVAAGAGLVVSAPRLALAQDGLDKYIGAPAKVGEISYDEQAGAIAGCTLIPVGLYQASQKGKAGFGVKVDFSYTSAGNPVKVTATTALSELSKVEIDKGTVEVPGCILAPPPDDINTVKAEAFIVKLGD